MDWRDKRQSVNVRDYSTYLYPYARTPIVGPEPVDMPRSTPSVDLFNLPPEERLRALLEDQLGGKMFRDAMDVRRKWHDQADIEWDALHELNPEIFGERGSYIEDFFEPRR